MLISYPTSPIYSLILVIWDNFVSACALVQLFVASVAFANGLFFPFLLLLIIISYFGLRDPKYWR